MNSSFTKRPYHVVFICAISACIAFNEEQESLGNPIGKSLVDWDIRYQSYRNQESPIGNYIADAVLGAAQKSNSHVGAKSPQIAFVNSGAIRQQYFLAIRDRIPAGTWHESDITQLLPFSDPLVVLSIKGREIALALEHAVSRLGATDTSLSPYFLHVAGLSFSVDCSLEAQSLSVDGLSILKSGMRVSNMMLTASYPPTPLDPNARYQVAMTTYLADGNDGFISFVQRNKKDRALMDHGRFLPRYLTPENLILDAHQTPFNLASSVIAWTQGFTSQGLYISQPQMGRMNMHQNCRIENRA